MKKRLWKQITAIIIVCALITGTAGINTNAALAASNRKNTVVADILEKTDDSKIEESGIKENTSKEEKSPELDMIVKECKEIKAGKTSIELKKGEIVSVSSVVGYDEFKAAIMLNGDLYCWGYNGNGQIGNGTTDIQLTPVKVLSGVKSVTYSFSDYSGSSPDSSVAAITKNGDLYCWGYNGYGQVGNGIIDDQLINFQGMSD